MPRADRLVELVHLLGGRRPRSLAEMVDHFQVSERTIYRDLADLGLRNIPVARARHGYRLVEGAQLRPLNLTAKERAVLKVALANPALRKTPGLGRHLATLEAKLDAVTAQAVETPEALALATVDRTGPMSEHLFAVLHAAVEARRTIELLYSSLSGGTRAWRGVDPYRIFHRADAWYLVGRCHVHDEARTFRLDRIHEVRPTPDTFVVPRDFSLDGYLRDAWTIVRGARPTEIVLHFDASLALLLRHAQHHASEVVQTLVGGEIEYRARVSHLDEVARWVMGFGGRCRVVKPPALRRRVVDLAEGAARAQAPRAPARKQRRPRKRAQGGR